MLLGGHGVVDDVWADEDEDALLDAGLVAGLEPEAADLDAADHVGFVALRRDVAKLRDDLLEVIRQVHNHFGGVCPP